MSHCRITVSYPAGRQDVHEMIDAVAHSHPGVSWKEPEPANDQRIGACWLTAIDVADFDGEVTDGTAAIAADFIQEISRRFRTHEGEPFAHQIKAEFVVEG